MQAYEELVASLLEREGFWVRQSFKVELTKDDKKKIGRPSVGEPQDNNQSMTAYLITWKPV